MFEFNATFLIAMISFVVFIIIMNAILYKPILSIISKRENYIDENLNAAKNSKEKAQGILDEKETKLAESSLQSRQIISGRVQQENDKAKRLTEEAKTTTQKNIASAKENLRNEEVQTTNSLSGNIKELAESISEKILGEKTSIDNVDYELISKVLK